MTTAHEPRPFRAADLARRAELAFDIAPDDDAREALAGRLGLLGLRKLRFAGRLVPEGRRDWRLEATLGATVVQPCVVTLAPVTTRLDEPVARRYLADWTDPDPGSEVEMPADDSVEPLGTAIDPAQVMEEALALALPLYPRAQGAEFGEAVFGAPGALPLTDEAVRPFAPLAKLRRPE